MARYPSRGAGPRRARGDEAPGLPQAMLDAQGNLNNRALAREIAPNARKRPQPPLGAPTHLTRARSEIKGCRPCGDLDPELECAPRRRGILGTNPPRPWRALSWSRSLARKRQLHPHSFLSPLCTQRMAPRRPRASEPSRAQWSMPRLCSACAHRVESDKVPVCLASVLTTKPRFKLLLHTWAT